MTAISRIRGSQFSYQECLSRTHLSGDGAFGAAGSYIVWVFVQYIISNLFNLTYYSDIFNNVDANSLAKRVAFQL